MNYRRLGRTDRFLSVFSLGLMRCTASADLLTETIAAAWVLGINHWETAQSYGESEVYLGQALQQLALPRSDYFVTTKLTPLPGATTGIAVERSLQRLQLEFVDAIAIHGINTPEHLAQVLAPGGMVEVLQDLQRCGFVRHLGFSTHGSLDLILETIASGHFSFVNLHYSVFFQRNAPALDLAQQKDMGVLIISPADKAGLLHQPPERLTHLCAPLSPLHLNYRFLLADPRITTLSFGAAQPEDLAILKPDVTDVGAGLKPAPTQAILSRLEHTAAEQLGTDRCSQCYACLPCPETIAIPDILRLRNLAIAYDMTDFGQYRYAMLENAGHWFPGRRGDRCTDCGDCLPRCPENLDIPRLLRDAHDRLHGSYRRRLWE